LRFNKEGEKSDGDDNAMTTETTFLAVAEQLKAISSNSQITERLSMDEVNWIRLGVNAITHLHESLMFERKRSEIMESDAITANERIKTLEAQIAEDKRAHDEKITRIREAVG
jgi:hypothetical protein